MLDTYADKFVTVTETIALSTDASVSPPRSSTVSGLPELPVEMDHSPRSPFGTILPLLMLFDYWNLTA